MVIRRREWLALILLTLASGVLSEQICSLARLEAGLLRAGVVNLVYTMDSQCTVCLHQAGRLPHLKRYLEKKGIKTHIVIGVSNETDKLSGLVPHVKVNSRRVWDALGQRNNHFYVIDRCGRMVYEIVRPWSNLNIPFVRSAVVTAHQSHRCGLCPADYISEDQREDASEISVLNEKTEMIPEDIAIPIKMVIKLRHREDTVKMEKIPDHSSHNGDEVRIRHAGHRARARHHHSEKHYGSPAAQEQTTSSITNQPKESLTGRIEKSVEQTTQNIVIKTSFNSQSTTTSSLSNFNNKPPDGQKHLLPEDRIDEKRVLLEHYKHILDRIDFTNDYDYNS